MRSPGLLSEIRACTICKDHLPLGPRPALQGQKSARLRIIGQAPGTRVHETGIPWNDPSGNVLRGWLKMTRDDFYDPARVAITSMSFCYPGRDRNGGDRPPLPACAASWHGPLTAYFENVRLILLIGAYAQRHYLGPRMKGNMTETVRAWRDYADGGFFVLPHPSWRNLGWQKRNPWFAEDLLPALRKKVKAILKNAA